MRRPRGIARLIIVCLFTAGFFGAVALPSNADCVGPTLEVNDRTVPAGSLLTVRGQYFGTECNDTGSSGWGGCGGGGSASVLGPPATDMDLRIVPRRSEAGGIVLASGIDADDHYTFQVQVTLPLDLDPGAYYLWADDLSFTRIRVREPM